MKHTSRFRQIVTVAILFLFSVHLLIVAALTFAPRTMARPSSLPARLYAYFVHLGPFYREESIRSSPHVVVSTGEVTIDLIQEYHSQYLVNPWRADKLLLRDYTRRVADQLSTREPTRSLDRISNLPEISKMIGEKDSATLFYFHSFYDLDNRRHVKNVNPKSIYVLR